MNNEVGGVKDFSEEMVEKLMQEGFGAMVHVSIHAKGGRRQ